jgi:nitrogen fixation NifU-like protein
MSFPELDDLYREVVLDHYQNPRGGRPLQRCDAANEGFNPVCGDEVKIGLQVDDGRVTAVQVESRGCSISVASGSMLAELLPGRTLFEVKLLAEDFRRMMRGEISSEDVDLGDLEALAGVRRFPVRVKCALLPWTTLNDALEAAAKLQAPTPSSTEDKKRSGRPGLTPPNHEGSTKS